MASRILKDLGRTYEEFSILPGHTGRECTINSISLETKLAGFSPEVNRLIMKIPFLSAAMTSVTGYELALALGKEGGIGVLPARLPVEAQADIVKRIKNYEREFVEKPVHVTDDATVEEVLRQVARYGHSEIPVVDGNNYFKGMFELQHYREVNAHPSDLVTKAMIPFDDSERMIYVKNPGISVADARKLLQEKNKKYLVVLDDDSRLAKLAFRQDAEKVKVASAISTHPGWEKRVRANVDAGVDLIVIDTSDAYSDFVADVIKSYKSTGINVPLCAGNVVTYKGAEFLMRAGADIVKIGMSSGSICITAREKAVGRAPMTALMEIDRARKEYHKNTGKYIPIVMDGGVANAANMAIALTLADAVMMGGYFNKFYEAEGEKFDENGSLTTDESKMKKVATWGEGSSKAQNLDRYGHESVKTFFPEGVEGLVDYAGRMKPKLREDILKIKAAMSNVGSMDLKEFREKVVLELNSQYASYIISNPHNIEFKK